jgi:hypothetical protein
MNVVRANGMIGFDVRDTKGMGRQIQSGDGRKLWLEAADGICWLETADGSNGYQWMETADHLDKSEI